MNIYINTQICESPGKPLTHPMMKRFTINDSLTSTEEIKAEIKKQMGFPAEKEGELFVSGKPFTEETINLGETRAVGYKLYLNPAKDATTTVQNTLEKRGALATNSKNKFGNMQELSKKGHFSVRDKNSSN